MAKKKTRQLPELPLLLCVHCSQLTPIPCSPRAWRWASEKCPSMKKAEDDFYRRNAGGPVAMTSLTRGRGFSGIVGDNDRHVASRQAALNKAALDWDWIWRAMAADDSGDQNVRSSSS